jgi:non-canonical (house-cleaning) NTP pyrophosphatase
MLKVAIGTMSEQKIGYVREVFSELQLKVELHPIDVISGVSEQPLTLEATRYGAENRAKSAFLFHSNLDFSIGIEVGYFLNDKDCFSIHCWASITDATKKLWSECSDSFLLPRFHQDILKQGLPLGEYVEKYAEESTDPVKLKIREMIRGRRPFITDAVRRVFIQFLK